MSLFKFLRIPSIYMRRESISTTTSRKCDEKTVSENIPVEPREIVTVEKSLRYLKSKAYQQTYGNEPVWTHYRRNFKGQFPPDTRRNCYTGDKLNNSSPCPICRDIYLVVDYQNTELLKQFISPYGGHVLETKKTGVCQKQHRNLLVAIQKAKDLGLIGFDIPHRSYNYSIYTKKK